jgi:two-component system, OmpR family, response regulator CpxR
LQRARQPANAPARPIRQAASPDSVLKPIRDARRQNREAMRPKKTILCVDDNEQILSVRTFLLETRGYRVIAIASPLDALEAVANSIPGTIDLLLSDLVMPQMDGSELVRRAKEIHPGLPAMIVSGTVSAFERAGRADVFLPKGACSPAELLERVRILVARKRGPKKSIQPPPRDPATAAIASSSLNPALTAALARSA